VARRRRAERFYACGALQRPRAARSTRTLDAMERISFRRHFILLAIASVLLLALRDAPSLLKSENNFVLYGVLHALTVVGALRRPIPALEVGTFIVAGAILSLGAVYAGMYFGGAFGILVSDTFTIYAMLVAGSAVGAITYGLIVRLLWLRQLPFPSIALIATGCALTTLATALLQPHGPTLGVLLTLIWWWTFSALLWSQTVRPWHLTMRWSGP
jgi:hypothetical protein